MVDLILCQALCLLLSCSLSLSLIHFIHTYSYSALKMRYPSEITTFFNKLVQSISLIYQKITSKSSERKFNFIGLSLWYMSAPIRKRHFNTACTTLSVPRGGWYPISSILSDSLVKTRSKTFPPSPSVPKVERFTNRVKKQSSTESRNSSSAWPSLCYLLPSPDNKIFGKLKSPIFSLAFLSESVIFFLR